MKDFSTRKEWWNVSYFITKDTTVLLSSEGSIDFKMTLSI